jgi:hypothetical protein
MWCGSLQCVVFFVFTVKFLVSDLFVLFCSIYKSSSRGSNKFLYKIIGLLLNHLQKLYYLLLFSHSPPFGYSLISKPIFYSRNI